MESNQGHSHVLSIFLLLKNPISLTFFFFSICEVPDLRRLLRQPSHPKRHSLRSGFPPPPKESPLRLPICHQSRHPACDSNQKIKQTGIGKSTDWSVKTLSPEGLRSLVPAPPKDGTPWPFSSSRQCQCPTQQQQRLTFSMRARCSCCRTHRIRQTSLPATAS